MATYQARVEDYIGTVSDTQSITDHLTAAARSLIDKMPEEKLLINCSATEVAILNGGTDVAGYRVINAHKDGKGCIWKDTKFYKQVIDQNSIHYATSETPSAIYYGGKLHILPNGGKVTAITYPTVAYGDSTISDYPAEFEQLVVLDAAIQGAINKMGTEIVVLDGLTLGAVTSNINGTAWATAYPNQYSAISTALTAIGTEIGLANTELDDAATAVDADVDTALGLVNTAVDRMNTAVLLANTEFDKIAGEIDTADTTITDGSDIDKGMAQVSIAKERVANGNAYLEEARAGLAEAQGYIGEVSARIEQIRGFSSVADGYLKDAQGYVNEVSARLATLNNEIGEYTAIVNKEMNEYATNIQRSVSAVQGWKILIDTLEKQYENMLRKYL